MISSSRRGVAALLVVLLAALAAGGWWLLLRPAAPADAVAQPALAADGLLVVDAAWIERMGITLGETVAAEQLPVAVIPALIQPPANARVAVAATFPGVVVQTLVVEGDQVTKGQALATISSRELLTMGADVARAKARSGVAEAAAARLQTLSKEGIIAGARADEAQALAAEARAELYEKTHMLQMVSGDGSRGIYTLRAPLAGRVTRADIRAGDPLDGTTAPFVIDAANRYEVVGQLPERLVGAVAPGMTVSLTTAGGSEIAGRIIAVGATLDPHTRSASLKAEIPGSSDLVAGQAVQVAIARRAPAGAVSVPAAAVTIVDGETLVFVPADGGFAMRPVTSGGEANGRVVLISGVQAGDRLVVSGASALKALATMD